MQMRLLGGMVIAVLCATISPAQQGGTDLEQLKGTWRMVGYEALGKPAPAEEVAKLGISLRFDGDKYTEKSMGETAEEGTIKLQSDKKPKQFELNIASGPDKGKTQLGIYKLEGDTFTAAIAPPGSKDRPTALTTDLTSKFSVQVFRREK